MAKKKAPAKGESLIVASKVKAYIKSKKKLSSSEMIDALSGKIRCLLDRAIERTTANGRSTVKSQDL
jgi:hypothetical protein